MHTVALWCSGLLLSFLSVCVCLERDCVLGVVGRPVSLPCSVPSPLTSVNASIEWRRDEDVLLRSEWTQDGGQVDRWSADGASIAVDAALTGNMSLRLDTVRPTEDAAYYGLFVVSGENHTSAVCSVCLRAAASFSFPLLQREEAEPGDETAFLCHSGGGFPEPSVYWLINNTEEPPEGSVSTLTASLPDSHLYNVTSHLTVNISKDANVSCVIENLSMNQTLMSTSYGVKVAETVVGRASEAMWIFSTALCVVVGVMVIVGVAYQINLDRVSKRKKKEYHQYLSRRQKTQPSSEEEMQTMKTQSKETDV